MTTTQSKQGIELKKIAEQGDKLDDVAGGFMKLVKEEGIDTLEKFDPWLALGYEDNGWSNVVGRPAPGSTLTPAPRAVKQYASAIRAALKLGLVIADYEKMRNLVDAVMAKRKSLATPPAKLPDPELKGVLIRSTGHMNGALWHDAIVVIENLNEEDKDDFEQRLRKLVMRFQSKVPKEVRKPKAA
jgi:hypothetical protein